MANGPHDRNIEVALIGRDGMTGLPIVLAAGLPPLRPRLQVQTAHTALANGRAKLEERLARWLLMARDRGDTDELPVTHEFLSVMLGVRRAGVTVALNMLESRGLVRGERGTTVILDRDGLIAMTNGFYGTPEAEARRLFRSL